MILNIQKYKLSFGHRGTHPFESEDEMKRYVHEETQAVRDIFWQYAGARHKERPALKKKLDEERYEFYKKWTRSNLPLEEEDGPKTA